MLAIHKPFAESSLSGGSRHRSRCLPRCTLFLGIGLNYCYQFDFFWWKRCWNCRQLRTHRSPILGGSRCYCHRTDSVHRACKSPRIFFQGCNHSVAKHLRFWRSRKLRGNNEVGLCDLDSALRWAVELGWRFDTIEWETTLRRGFLWYRNRRFFHRSD